MSINHDDAQFIGEMVTELDRSIRRLVAEEESLSLRLGAERVAELREFWQKEFSPSEEESFKSAMDHEDKKLTWIWLRLERLHVSRAKAGQAIMKNRTH